jgi:pyridoxamine 5'-phosphate oxidase
MSASTLESLTGSVGLAFPEYDAPPAEPMALVRDWLAAAVACGVREPKALSLATADGLGRASNRVVVFTSVTDLGLVFTTHSTSQKGRELAETRWASGLLYWRETGQQIILSGPTRLVADVESEALWFARPTPLHSMSTASRQSDPIDDLATLRAESDRLASVGGPLPRPARFVGYHLTATVVEFWCAAPDRLHRRLRYDHDGLTWRTSRLQP